MLFSDQIAISILFDGFGGTAPNYSTLRTRQKLILRSASKKCSDRLHWLVDSTGLEFLGESEWKRKKPQPEYRRPWPSASPWYKC